MTNILRFLCAVLLCGAVAAPASAQYLTADEIKRLFGGTSVETYIWDNELAGGGGAYNKHPRRPPNSYKSQAGWHLGGDSRFCWFGVR